MNKITILLATLLCSILNFSQTNIVSYAGNSGKETFYDVLQITDGTFLVTGYADNLDWIPANITKTQLTFSGTIPNTGGSNRYGILLHLSANLQTILRVVHFPQGAVEDIRFIKTNTKPYSATGDLFISCNTTVLNPGGGYVIAKLNGNFITNVPTALSWNFPIWADGETKLTHPWDVTSNGEVYYVTGKAHGPDWSAIHCLDNNGVRKIIPNWRTHWSTTGAEWRGTPASASPTPTSYSGIALKSGGRAEFRSWNDADFNAINPDANGGTRKGKWPADFMFNTAGNPVTPITTSPGYNNYSSSGKVFGATSLIVDRRNNNLYIGMNFQTTTAGTPDFEPAIICYDNSGTMLWWDRLYHEITPAGATVQSLPDQYLDALAIDYTNNKLVVGARCHGNGTSNLYRGNSILANASANGFQNQFTGTNGNVHISWLGKFSLDAGNLSNSTFMAELIDGVTNTGSILTDANLDSWTNPNLGWPNLNTTRMAKNALKVSSNGDVCVLAVGRRTITTANAHQKMLKPSQGVSSWNEFVRIYDSNFSAPKYSSLIGGTWDPVSGVGGDNTDLFGVCKTTEGVVVVGRHVADANNVSSGNAIPVANVLPWGNATPNNESAILVYYKSTNLQNAGDTASSLSNRLFESSESVTVYPNPANDLINISFNSDEFKNKDLKFSITDLLGRNIYSGSLTNNIIDVSNFNEGIYNLKISANDNLFSKKIVVRK